MKTSEISDVQPDDRGQTADARNRAPHSASVIIPVLDGVPLLASQLQALAGQQDPRIPWEVIVADNGSSDGTRELVLRFADRLPRLRLVDASSRRGSSHARNVGAAAATGELLCFCDADDVVAPQWLAAHVRAAARHDVAGGPLEIDRLNSSRVRRWRPTPRTAVGKRPASFVPSGNMSIWAHVFGALDGFDETYLKSHDVELSQRASKAGCRIGWIEEARVHYRYRATLGGLARQAYKAGWAAVQMSLDHPGASPLPGWRRELKLWSRALVRLPLLLIPERRGSALRLLAEQVGRSRARLHYRKRLRQSATKESTDPERQG